MKQTTNFPELYWGKKVKTLHSPDCLLSQDHKQELNDSERCLKRPLWPFHIKANVKLHAKQKILSSINI